MHAPSKIWIKESIAHHNLAISAGLGTALGLLLRKRPDLLQTTAAARVLQLLMKQQQESDPVDNSLSIALGGTSLVDELIQVVQRPDGLLQGIACYPARGFLLASL